MRTIQAILAEIAPRAAAIEDAVAAAASCAQEHDREVNSWQASQQAILAQQDAERRQHRRSQHAAQLAEVQRLLLAIQRDAAGLADPWGEEGETWNYAHPATTPAVLRIGTLTLPSSSGPLITAALLPFSGGSNLIVQAAGPARQLAARALQGMVLRLLVTVPAGKLRLLLIDPIGLGQNLTSFIPQGEFLRQHVFAGSRGAAISADQFIQQTAGGKVWTEPADIEKRLAEMSSHMEGVIRKYLRNQFESLEQYNLKAHEIEEPYRLIAIANFPSGWNDQAAKRLVSIAANGPRCGVYTFLTWDTDQPLPHGLVRADLESAATVLSWNGSRFVWQDSVFHELEFEVDLAPPPVPAEALLRAVWEQALTKSRVELPFQKIAPAASSWKRSDSRHELSIVIGRAGADEPQYFVLGQGTAVHALITGKTGAGKSNLLHVLILALAMSYPPEELEIYLIDFKKGVEFKVYAPRDGVAGALPHARVIAIESEREFGVSCLSAVHLEMDRRGKLFRETRCENLLQYREKTGNPLPRLLLLVDEFQVFFEEDDALSDRARLLLDQLVSQSRAFGIHVVLASQTLERARSLPAGSLNQLEVRIALKAGSEQDSLKMLGTRDAFTLLDREGEAFYNSTGGLPQSNTRFQVAYADEELRQALCRELMARHPGLDAVVFEGNRPATLMENRPLRDLLAANAWKARPRVVKAILGQPVTIGRMVVASFAAEPGRNLLLLGRQEETAVGILCGTLCCLALQLSPEAAAFHIIDCSTPDSEWRELPARLRGLLPHPATITRPRDLPGLLQHVAQVIKDRQASSARPLPKIFLLGFAMQRARLSSEQPPAALAPPTPRLRTSDEISPGKADLAAILRDGPEVDVHTIGWWDSYTSLGKTLDRSALRDVGMRIALNMSRDDSRSVIEETDAARLGMHRALLWDEAEAGYLEKFVPFEVPDAELLHAVEQSFARRDPAYARKPGVTT
jgi:S-DNA-T family DNA segregation ATPase FtsK/SpoIIIE